MVRGKIDVVLGMHWGDEGKGKIVDYLSEKYDIVARFQGGPNADHGIMVGDKHIELKTIPSGIVYEDKICVLGSGMVINPVQLLEEIAMLEEIGVKNIKERLYISDRVHIITPLNLFIEQKKEGTQQIGTTKSGIGPTYVEKVDRNGLRLCDIESLDEFEQKYNLSIERFSSVYNLEMYELETFNNMLNKTDEFLKSLKKLKEYNIVNLPYKIDKWLNDGKNILAEGAQGTLLDIDYGTYPYVTSTNTVSAEACISLGVGPKDIDKVYGVVKAYTTRIGNGSFPTEQDNEIGDKLRELGQEYAHGGTQPRRCGWLDLVTLNYSCMINGVTDLVLTKTDIMDQMDEFKVASHYLYDDGIRGLWLNGTERKIIEPVYHDIKDMDDLLEKILISTNLKVSIVSYGTHRNETKFL